MMHYGYWGFRLSWPALDGALLGCRDLACGKLIQKVRQPQSGLTALEISSSGMLRAS